MGAITVSLSGAVEQELRQYADEMGHSLSAVVEGLALSWLQSGKPRLPRKERANRARMPVVFGATADMPVDRDSSEAGDAVLQLVEEVRERSKSWINEPWFKRQPA